MACCASPQSKTSLRAQLAYEPRTLSFGTSGRRGLVADLSQLEIYINALAELEFLLTLPRAEGGIEQGEEFYYACDLRPSSTEPVEGSPRRGQIAQAIHRAIADAGLRPVFCGAIPTPALAHHAFQRQRGSMMITGSHIPFDRNGYKTNTSRGELLKSHEGPIAAFVERTRTRLYAQPYAASLFAEDGNFKIHEDLPAADPAARQSYKRRYTEFFPAGALSGLRILFYQHSAVGRDLVVEILSELGAQVFPAGRSDQFIPIDTENIDAERLDAIQQLVDAALAEHGPLDAILSTDGDSDRPLLLGLDAQGKAQFFSGDRLGMIVAESLAADAVVVPITCNDAIDRSPLAAILEPKTRIGSPYVISGMLAAASKGREKICGWEANGGFLTGSEIVAEGRTLAPLPTRDAVLPLLAALVFARQEKKTLVELFARLPERLNRAGLLRNFPRPVWRRIAARYASPVAGLSELDFLADSVELLMEDGSRRPAAASELPALQTLRETLARHFSAAHGFAPITRLNFLDGLRLGFANGDVAHLRASGNADELRVYSVADTMERAEAIVACGLAEPDGIVRSMEREAGE